MTSGMFRRNTGKPYPFAKISSDMAARKVSLRVTEMGKELSLAGLLEQNAAVY